MTCCNLPVKQVTLHTSSAITADWLSTKQTNRGYRGVRVVIDISASTDTPSVVFNILGYDPVSTETFLILASAAQTGTTAANTPLQLTVYPGVTETANVDASNVLPKFWYLQADGSWGGTDAITFTAVATLLP